MAVSIREWRFKVFAVKVWRFYIREKPVKMAPQPLKMGTSNQSKVDKTAPRSAAGLAKKAEKSKKRAVEQVEEASDEEFGDQGSGIDMSDDEEELDGDDEEEDEDEAFPEFDSELEDNDEEEASDEGQDEQDTSDEGEILEEDSGSESGYNTSDIERMYASDDDLSSEENKDLPVDEKLSRLIAKNTVKPDDSIGTDDKISRAKEGVGRLVPSKHVKGSFVREYDDYEAGYGSESSTEDVSYISVKKVQLTIAEPQHCR